MTRPPRGPGRSADTILHTVNDLLIEALLPEAGHHQAASIWRDEGILALPCRRVSAGSEPREATDMIGGLQAPQAASN
jgi:hypothetical protein